MVLITGFSYRWFGLYQILVKVMDREKSRRPDVATPGLLLYKEEDLTTQISDANVHRSEAHSRKQIGKILEPID